MRREKRNTFLESEYGKFQNNILINLEFQIESQTNTRNKAAMQLYSINE